MKRSHRILIVLVLLALVLPTSGCSWARLKLGLGIEITETEAGTPERIVQDALKAALDNNPKKGWSTFMGMLHTNQKNVGSLKSWEGMKYRDFRKKVTYYITDPGTTSYKLMRVRDEDDGGVSLYIQNIKSDMPTPCTVRQDPDDGMQWRITRCSL
jgi:hypothetical protein